MCTSQPAAFINRKVASCKLPLGSPKRNRRSIVAASLNRLIAINEPV
jgi:hypothetical protein